MKGVVYLSVTDFFKSIGAADLLGKSSVAVVILLTILQIAPIKLNPWSWLVKFPGKLLNRLTKRIGKAINGEVITELGDIKKRLTDLEERNKQQDDERVKTEALNARRRILRFADELRQKVLHSEEHFNNIFEDIKCYETFCREHEGFENNRARISIKIIEETYEKCVHDNSFL